STRLEATRSGRRDGWRERGLRGALRKAQTERDTHRTAEQTIPCLSGGVLPCPTMTYFDQVAEAAAFLRGKLGTTGPRIGIVLGSGLGAVADAVTEPVVVPYAEVPHFPHSTVEGHSGRMVAGLLGGVPVVAMQGRVHFYEGYSPLEVTFPMRVLG